MSESKKSSTFLPYFIVVITVVGLFFFASIDCGHTHRISPYNACINNLRELDSAKEKWVLEHNAKTNDLVTLDDIKPYLPPYGEPNGFIKLDANGNLPRCPAGGVYSIGKVGEFPTCSLGTSVTPSHVLTP
jgi:hypothetical protein